MYTIPARHFGECFHLLLWEEMAEVVELDVLVEHELLHFLFFLGLAIDPEERLALSQSQT
jgi:hypothetical protein